MIEPFQESLFLFLGILDVGIKPIRKITRKLKKKQITIIVISIPIATIDSKKYLDNKCIDTISIYHFWYESRWKLSYSTNVHKPYDKRQSHPQTVLLSNN